MHNFIFNKLDNLVQIVQVTANEHDKRVAQEKKHDKRVGNRSFTVNWNL